MEYAPQQRTPYKARTKEDARQGTIEQGKPLTVKQP